MASNTFTFQECGSIMTGYGNACFWLSILEGMKQKSLVVPSSYQEVMRIAGINEYGKMFNTDEYFENAEQFADHFGISIVAFLQNDEKNGGTISLPNTFCFGKIQDIHRRIYVVKIGDIPHFRLCTSVTTEAENYATQMLGVWSSPQNPISRRSSPTPCSLTRPQTPVQNLSKTPSDLLQQYNGTISMENALALARSASLAEEIARKKKQELEDEVFAQQLAEQFEAELKQISRDRAFAKSLQEV